MLQGLEELIKKQLYRESLMKMTKTTHDRRDVLEKKRTLNLQKN